MHVYKKTIYSPSSYVPLHFANRWNALTDAETLTIAPSTNSLFFESNNFGAEVVSSVVAENSNFDTGDVLYFVTPKVNPLGANADTILSLVSNNATAAIILGCLILTSNYAYMSDL